MLRRIKIGFWAACCIFFQSQGQAQDSRVQADTVAGADSVEVTGQAFGSLHRNLSSALVQRHPMNVLAGMSNMSLLPAANTLAGVRMEERSPGSYRLNIRGSALRSPFGVRNIKMYWNGLPFTDAGGNTYFNQLATNSLQGMEILRGPASSMYGAGTGGLVLMQTLGPTWQPGAAVELSMGSYGMWSAQADVSFGGANNRNRITYAHNASDGYRRQSALRRDNMSWTSQLKISDRQQLTASFLYTNMYYQTPGGLTQAEYLADPRAARPAAGGFPSAEQAQAAIWQQNLLAGLNHQYKLHARWTNTTALYGAFALVENAAIRNYESRSEPHLGGRTVFAYEQHGQQHSVKWQTGVEYQAGFFNTQVSGNRNGSRDTLRTNDDLRFQTGFLFSQLDLSFNGKVFVSGGVSVNRNDVRITRLFPSPVQEQARQYRSEWAPRLQLTYRWPGNAETQFTFSRGFSPPTVSELLPSTGRISTDLEAEKGDNVELAQRFEFFQRRLQLNITAFYLRLRNTLVQQRDAAGADFFVNAGATAQKGLESSASWWIIRDPLHSVQTLQVNLAYTYSHFTFTDYRKLGVDYAGKQIPGVPRHAVSLLGQLSLRAGFYAHLSWYYNSAIMLNDANSFSAEAFHLAGGRVGYKQERVGRKWWWQVYAGVDNLLNERYSLGNDINAAANRFYNAAPARNWLAGVAMGWR